MSWFSKDPLQIIAFQSYGSNTRFFARGRALEDESIDLMRKNIFSMILNTYKRFETDEIKKVPVSLKLPNNKVLNAITDENGYYKFEADLKELKSLTNSEGWLQFELSYDNANVDRTIQNENCFPGEMLIPSDNAKFGVVSDIDDTILHTGVVSTLKWRVIYNTVFKNVKRRLPLEGAADFYHKLHKGIDCDNTNPIFYVSHSPWNLYRYLEFFLKQNNFPKGPILLRSLSDFLTINKLKEKPQKQKEILNLLKTYPNLPFILIGDSGEHDADIYIEIAKKFPGRILAIYLRSVEHKKRMLRVEGLLNSYKTIPVLLVKDSNQAIEHAKKHGFIA